MKKTIKKLLKDNSGKITSEMFTLVVAGVVACILVISSLSTAFSEHTRQYIVPFMEGVVVNNNASGD